MDQHLFPDLESQSLATANRLISEYQAVFEELGLRVEPPEVECTVPSNPRIELSIFFWENLDFFDLLQVFILWNGKPFGSKEEIEALIREAIEEIIQRRKAVLAAGADQTP